MEEAKVSFNVKFRLQGFECQLTLRGDEEGSGPAITRAQSTVRILASLVGVTPTNGNSKPVTSPLVLPVSSPPEQPVKPVCLTCGLADQLELVSFQRGGKPHQAFKCQRCNKWLWDKK